MIKLIITDLTYLNADSLKTTANYLNELAKLKEEQRENKTQHDIGEEVEVDFSDMKLSFKTPTQILKEFYSPNLEVENNSPIETLTPRATPEKHTPLADLEKLPEMPKAPDNFKSIHEIPTATTEKDSAGLPWDARIHVSTKTKTTKGKWTYKRNLDRDFIDKVEAELRTVMGIPTPAPQVSSALNVPLNTTAITYPVLILKVTQAINGGKITQQQYIDMLNNLGINNPVLVSTRPDLFSVISEKLDEIIGG